MPVYHIGGQEIHVSEEGSPEPAKGDLDSRLVELPPMPCLTLMGLLSQRFSLCCGRSARLRQVAPAPR